MHGMGGTLAAVAWLAASLAAPGGHAAAQPSSAAPVSAPRAQNPSPMVESTRAHERLPAGAPAGLRASVEAGLPRPIDVFLPSPARADAAVRVLVHFHGAPHVAMHAAAMSSTPTLAVNVHLGAGSSAYDRPFSDVGALERVLQASLDAVARETGRRPTLTAVHLTAFSAGYGAIRALARQPGFTERVAGVLLLDGLHASYVPEGRVLAEGGAIEMRDLEPFVTLARRAAAGEMAFVVTHSEIFPGTFASTTEATDAILAALGLTRTAVLKWGPLGMQQLSEASRGRFTVLGFAGNAAPDHVDHLHALPHLASLLDDARR